MPSSSLQEILSLPVEGRIEPLASYAKELAKHSQNGSPPDPDSLTATVEALLALVEDGSGSGRQRLLIGEALGLLEDPRLRTPDQADYWAEVEVDDEGTILVGRFMVTTAEWRHFLDTGYDVDANWTAEGLAWRNSGAPTWASLAADPEIAHLVVANQPVVGVTWHEAEAYARAHGARLLTHEERKFVVRGTERRPYPWGAPYGEGNANSREEALGRPAAVGLFRRDRTPEGVWDLAANVGEWTADRVDAQRIYHPGSWAQPSMAAWAKALELAAPDTRSSDLGFRIVRDPVST